MAALRTNQGSKDLQENTVGEKNLEEDGKHFFFSSYTNIP